MPGPVLHLGCTVLCAPAGQATADGHHAARHGFGSAGGDARCALGGGGMHHAAAHRRQRAVRHPANGRADRRACSRAACRCCLPRRPRPARPPAPRRMPHRLSRCGWWRREEHRGMSSVSPRLPLPRRRGAPRSTRRMRRCAPLIRADPLHHARRAGEPARLRQCDHGPRCSRGQQRAARRRGAGDRPGLAPALSGRPDRGGVRSRSPRSTRCWRWRSAIALRSTGVRGTARFEAPAGMSGVCISCGSERRRQLVRTHPGCGQTDSQRHRLRRSDADPDQAGGVIHPSA